MVKENEMLQTEIGLLPEDWVISIIQNISHRIGDGIHSTPTYEESGDYFFVNGNNLKNGKVFVDDNTKTVSLEQFKIHKRDLSNRTILLSINGTIGNIAFFNGESIILGKSACYINLKKTVNKDFIYFLLQSNRVQKYFEENLTGSTIKNLGLGTISNTKIPIPPLPEQEAIASALSDADAWIESLEQLIDKKRLIKQGAMQELLTPKKDWEVKKLGEVVDFCDNERRPIKSSDRQSGVYPYYGASGIIDFVSDYIFDGEYLLLGEDGENILSRNLPLIYYVNQKCWVNNHAHVLKCKEFIEPKFLMNLLESLDFKNLNSGTAQPKLNKENCFNILLNIPSLTEQTRIATILSDMDAELEALATQLEKAKKIKQGMMQELLTGRIRLV